MNIQTLDLKTALAVHADQILVENEGEFTPAKKIKSFLVGVGQGRPIYDQNFLLRNLGQFDELSRDLDPKENLISLTKYLLWMLHEADSCPSGYGALSPAKLRGVLSDTRFFTLGQLGDAVDVITAVNTGDHKGLSSKDSIGMAKFINDIDLAIFAADSDVYQEYRSRVHHRIESCKCFIDLKLRQDYLRRLVNRPVLFYLFDEKAKNQAWFNIESELALS